MRFLVFMPADQRQESSQLTATLVTTEDAALEDRPIWIYNLADSICVRPCPHSVDVHLVKLGLFLQELLQTRPGVSEVVYVGLTVAWCSSCASVEDPCA